MNNYFINIEIQILLFGFTIIAKEFNKSWGGFLVIDEK